MIRSPCLSPPSVLIKDSSRNRDGGPRSVCLGDVESNKDLKSWTVKCLFPFICFVSDTHTRKTYMGVATVPPFTLTLFVFPRRLSSSS